MLPNLKLMDIVVCPDHVDIAGQRVLRPSRIAVSQWLDFWEGIVGWRRFSWER